jgi:CheY-like chemotaxis protein
MLHVLLVEDNPADAQMVREAIRASPVMADVMIAYDGEQALQSVIELVLCQTSSSSISLFRGSIASDS